MIILLCLLGLFMLPTPTPPRKKQGHSVLTNPHPKQLAESSQEHSSPDGSSTSVFPGEMWPPRELKRLSDSFLSGGSRFPCQMTLIIIVIIIIISISIIPLEMDLGNAES